MKWKFRPKNSVGDRNFFAQSKLIRSSLILASKRLRFNETRVECSRSKVRDYDEVEEWIGVLL